MLFLRIFGKCPISLCGEALAMCFLRVPFLGKSKSIFRNPKTDFAFFWTNPETDHESIKPLVVMFFYVYSVCLRRFIFQVIFRLHKNSYNFNILRSVFYSRNVCVSTEIYSFRIFIRTSCCFFFLSSLWGSVRCFFFFFVRGARGHPVVMVNDPFLDLPFFW